MRAVYFGNTSCDVWRGVLWAMGNDVRGGRGGIGWFWGLYLYLVLKYSQDIKVGNQELYYSSVPTYVEGVLCRDNDKCTYESLSYIPCSMWRAHIKLHHMITPVSVINSSHL